MPESLFFTVCHAAEKQTFDSYPQALVVLTLVAQFYSTAGGLSSYQQDAL